MIKQISSIITLMILSHISFADSYIKFQSPVQGNLVVSNGILENFFSSHGDYKKIKTQIDELKDKQGDLYAIAGHQFIKDPNDNSDSRYQIDLYVKDKNDNLIYLGYIVATEKAGTEDSLGRPLTLKLVLK